MNIDLNILWGFLALGSWGAADYLARLTATHVGSRSTAFLILVIGLALPLALVISEIGGTSKTIDWIDFLALGLVVGGLLAAAYTVYYAGLEKGSVSVVSSMASAWLLVSLLIAIIAFGERLSIGQLIVSLAIVAGIVALSVNGKPGSMGQSGYSYGLGSMFLLGAALALFKPLTDIAGPFISVVAVRLIASIILGSYLSISRVGIVLPATRKVSLLVFSAATLDVLGYVGYNIGLDQAAVSLIAPIGAAHPLITILLALSFLHERPTRLQWFGIVVTVVGVVTLSGLVGN